jgi:hypothetical protein
VARYSHWKGDRKPDFTSCSFFSPPIEPAVPVLRIILKLAERGEDEYLDIKAILQAPDEVLGRYQELSHPRKDLGSLTAEELRYFPYFSNRRWTAGQTPPSLRSSPAVSFCLLSVCSLASSSAWNIMEVLIDPD